MNAVLSQSRSTWLAWPKAIVWLGAFLLPTAYLLLILLASRFQITAPPPSLLLALFCLIPVVALVVCSAVVWHSTRTNAARVGWLAFTVLAMLLQMGVILFVLSTILVAMTSYAQ